MSTVIDETIAAYLIALPVSVAGGRITFQIDHDKIAGSIQGQKVRTIATLNEPIELYCQNEQILAQHFGIHSNPLFDMLTLPDIQLHECAGEIFSARSREEAIAKIIAYYCGPVARLFSHLLRKLIFPALGRAV